MSNRSCCLRFLLIPGIVCLSMRQDKMVLRTWPYLRDALFYLIGISYLSFLFSDPQHRRGYVPDIPTKVEAECVVLHHFECGLIFSLQFWYLLAVWGGGRLWGQALTLARSRSLDFSRIDLDDVEQRLGSDVISNYSYSELSRSGLVTPMLVGSSDRLNRYRRNYRPREEEDPPPYRNNYTSSGGHDGEQAVMHHYFGQSAAPINFLGSPSPGVAAGAEIPGLGLPAPILDEEPQENTETTSSTSAGNGHPTLTSTPGVSASSDVDVDAPPPTTSNAELTPRQARDPAKHLRRSEFTRIFQQQTHPLSPILTTISKPFLFFYSTLEDFFHRYFNQPIYRVIQKTAASDITVGARNEEKYGYTMLSSVVWMSFFSWLLSCTVQRWVMLSGLPEAFFGFTLLAISAEIPDTIQAIAIARRGHGDMAIT